MNSTGFESVPRPAIVTSTGPAVRARFARWMLFLPGPGLKAVPIEITSPGYSVWNLLMKATTAATL